MIRRPPRSTRTAHSFPTRRSSDLRQAYEPLFRDRRGRSPRLGLAPLSCRKRLQGRIWPGHRQLSPRCTLEPWRDRRGHPAAWRRRGQPARSEEHTSELQSLMRISYAVFCLKKKNKIKRHKNASIHNRKTVRKTVTKL